MYIYEKPDWPEFKWDNARLINLLSRVRNLQGRIIGRMGALGFELRNRSNLEILTQDILKSTEIEGEFLNPEQVRSSLARRLKLDISGLVHSDKNVDGVVDMTLDATGNYDKELDTDRLFSWHRALFPEGYSGMYKVVAGKWRDDSTGPMQVVSGPMGKEEIHYQAPPAANIDKEMKTFFEWLNNKYDVDLALKAGVAHLWFVTIHPFEDGNGRIARAITDMILARSDEQSYRFYSMSSQIRNEREGYYNILEQTQKGNLDITDWLEWFLNCLLHALDASELVLSNVILKHNFWITNALKIDNARQKKILNMLIDGFEGKLTSSKWAKICQCSQDTAFRDIQDLLNKQILYKLAGGGRSTGYDLVRNL
jgi:Fic family protein